MWRALAAFGAPLDGLKIAKIDFLKTDVVVQFGLPPYRIDILTGISGVTFNDAWSERIDDLFDGVRVHFLGKSALIRNQRAAGRLKDLADLESLGEDVS